MANLIDFGDPQPKSHYSMSCASNKLFGVIKRECFAVEVAGMNDSIGEKLQPGILIQMIPDYSGDQCHFKIRNFTNWQDKYKTVIYKCTKDDFIVVTGELFPYLLALKNDKRRVELVQNVYNKEFDLEIIKLGSEIRIRGPPGTVKKYYEFRVTYIGVVKKIGIGYYIGLQLKNDDISFSDLKYLSQYYQFGGTTGIVVSLDWIMLNLYKEGEYQYEPLITPLNKVASMKETGVLPKMRNFVPNCATEIERNKDKELYDRVKKAENVTLIRTIKGQPMKSFETGATLKQSNQPLTTTSNFDELNKMFKEIEIEPNYGSKNVENNYLRRTPIIAHSTKIDIATHYRQPPEGPKIEFNNNAAIEIERNKEIYDTRKKTANMLTSTRPINRQSMKSSETGSTLKQRDQPPQTSCDTPIAYGEFINNSLGMKKMELNDGTKNVENNYVRTSQVILQPNKTIETGAMSTKNQHSSENRKKEFNNNAVGPKQMNPNDSMKNAENNYERTSPTTEIGIMPRQHHQPTENPSHTTSNFVAEIELINNLDGAVKNVEKTKCDLCSMIVEIGHGIILRECLHSFCMRCITIHVTSNVNYSGIRCPYKKEYECEFDLQDAEIKNLGGEIIYNKILENRLKNLLKQNLKEIRNNSENVQRHLPIIIEQRKKTNETGVLPKFSAPNCINEIERNKEVHDRMKKTKTIETGAMSTQCHQSPEGPKTEFNNNAVGSNQMNPNDPMKNAENNYERTSPTTEIGIMPRQHHQPTENPSHTTSNYVAEIELINNLDGAVKNVEKTKCDLCSMIVEIGHGIILRECLHSFCMRCITIHVTSNVNYSGIRCPYKKEYECEFDLQDAEIKNLGGEIIYNKILENRLKNLLKQNLKEIRNNSENVQRHLPIIIEQRKKTNETGVLPKFSAPNCINEIERNKEVHDRMKKTKTIETGAMSTQCHQSPEGPKTEFNNNAVGSNQMNPNDPMKNAENNYERTSPTTEIGIMPRQHHQPTENPSHTTSNYVAEIELINNLNGAVKNVEKTKCDLCSMIVEIGHGIILRECLHSFCMRCITIHVTSNVNYSGIRCPYKKEYECEFDLQDAEIKNLGGEIIYNKILENRLKEYVWTEPNARECPNKACGNVWVSIREQHQTYERCPKCNANWCFICESSHEPEDGHGNKFGKPTFVNKVLKMFGADSSEPTVACAKCRKTNISVTEYVRLQNCNHTICKNCSLSMIKSQTSGSLRAQCVVCNSYLEDMEVAKIAGLEVLNIFLSNRKIQIQNDSAVLQEMCVCGPSVSNCSIVLKCAHKFCRTYIVGLVQEQFSSNHRAACPRCLQEIDKSQIRRIVPGLIKDEIIEKCEICSNPVDVHLAICKHGFCHKCVHVMITKHVYDPSEKNVICTICQNPITSRDVSNYGGDEIFAQYQSKFEVSKLISKSVSPKEMCVCRPPNVNCGFILKCGHTFCRTYIADIVKKQLNNKGSAACPMCCLEIDKIEIGHLVPGQIKNEAVNKCQNCSIQVGLHLINCQHRFCLKCLQNIITTQVFDPKKSFVTCTSCDENVTDQEISIYGSKELFARYKTKFGATPKPVGHITLNEKPFECYMCEKQISIKGGIILAGCSHWFCIECCKESIDHQLSIPKQPECYLCLKELAQYEIEALIGKPTQIS